MRKKIRLDVEELAVESFATAEDRAARGTVKGHDFTQEPVIGCQQESASGPFQCVCGSDPRWGTCDTSCNPDWCDCNPTSPGTGC